MIQKSPIPDAALAQHIAVLGKTGSGKSYCAKAVIVEPLLETGRRVAVIDPTGAWFGLRSSRDGKGPGFPILVLGGDHGDLPLPALGGAAVARLLSEQGVNLVADTSMLTVGERTRWFIDFATTLYRLNRQPLNLVLDEAHMFAPQGKVPDPDTGKMLHAANTLASGGRSRGIRLTMITQRPQKLHKDALTSADTLIAMRVLAPHDRSAVEDWIKGCGDIAQGKEVLNSLASLQRGEGWVWYPEGGFLQRMKFPAIKTFDSSATPTGGHALATPKGAAEIDLTEIRTALADAVKEAEANDPKLLRAEIARLKHDIGRAAKNHSADLTAEPAALAEAEHRGYARGKIEGYQEGLAAFPTDRLGELDRQMEDFRANVKDFSKGVAAWRARAPTPRSAKPPQIIREKFTPARNLSAKGNGSVSKSGLGGPQQRILDALAWWESAGVQQPSRVQVAVVARYSPSGGAFQNPLGNLRATGMVEYPTSGTVRLTDAGRSAATASEPPAVEELHSRVMGILDGPQRRILQPLLDAYPDELTREAVAAKANYEPNGGAFQNPLGSLRSLGLIDYPAPGRVVALPVLFLQ